MDINYNFVCYKPSIPSNLKQSFIEMKKLKSILHIGTLAIIMFAFLEYSCSGGREYGPVEKESREVSGFDVIHVSSGIKVYLTMGSAEVVEVEAEKELLEHLVTEVRGGMLKIYFDQSFAWNKSTIVYIEGKNITRISASGGSDVIGRNAIESSDLDLKSSGGSNIKLKVKTKSLVADLSGGADITISGFTDQLQARSSGGSDLKALELIAKKARLEASGGADIKVHVSEQIDANASGGADIAYRGNPEVLNSKTSSGAGIMKKN
jgi:hypothetical protein